MKAAVIGSSGRGNYGHGLDVVWNDVPDVETVALADSDDKGRAAAIERIGGTVTVHGFADYREMLDLVKPDVVSVCPRWPDQHHDMVVACAERGVRGIYLEKPMCRTLEEADAMVDACEKHRVKLAIAYQTRYSPVLRAVDEIIDSGKIGEVLELRGRGKEDHRGGGEDLWVLGSHVMNMMEFFGGRAKWCSAEVLENGKPVTAEHVKDGNEGIGPLAGDCVRAMYGMSGKITAYFSSQKDKAGSPTRFGLMIYGSEGLIWLSHGYLPQAHWLPDSSWTPGRTAKEWTPITSNGVGKPESLEVANNLHAGNVAACKELI
ncbi:MAG: Gfo/Idh/MocA family oxidoreductase, partial [Verrucomicrobia bacterium]|nr:Gfo/Idh/MocA family oxidoreductase [Verrucomicrobiota bacterium]